MGQLGSRHSLAVGFFRKSHDFTARLFALPLRLAVAGSNKRPADGLRWAHHFTAGRLPCSTKDSAILTARENVSA
jgi:hypothetical protein